MTTMTTSCSLANCDPVEYAPSFHGVEAPPAEVRGEDDAEVEPGFLVEVTVNTEVGSLLVCDPTTLFAYLQEVGLVAPQMQWGEFMGAFMPNLQVPDRIGMTLVETGGDGEFGVTVETY